MAWYNQLTNTLDIHEKVNAAELKYFCGAISAYKKSGSYDLRVDFSNVVAAYPNGVLPIITTLQKLRGEGHQINVLLPNDDYTRRLFRSTNWAHFLSPEQYDKSESKHDRHLVTTQFTNATEQHRAVDDTMDVILRNMELSRDIISGLEWSINELTDNVLNHSNSPFGGYIQATTYLQEGLIAFAVADSGRGILNSLREGIPTLRTDLQALGEAIKAGVTRNPKFGQGNGLAGSLRVTSMTGGSFEITSGIGNLVVTSETTAQNPRTSPQYFEGTLVSGQLRNNRNFSVTKALIFQNGKEHRPTDLIELRYELEDKDCLYINLKDETTGFGSRQSGHQIRTKTINLINAQPSYPLVLNWEGIPVISSSFADEFIGKLFIRLGAMSFSSRIRNINMEPLIQGLLDKAVAQRLTQASDEYE